MSLVLGVTGKYCAGKNRLAGLLMARGFREVDADKLGHQALEACADQVVQLFGPGIGEEPGETGARRISRRRLGDIVFRDARALRALEGVVHPWIRERAREQIEEAAAQDVPALIHAALLHRMGMEDLCTAVIWVQAPPLLRFFRALRRDGFHPIKILRRMAAQRDISPQFFSSQVDTFTVVNIPGAKNLNLQLSEILTLWKK